MIATANHGGPWMCDSYIPVIFAGWKLKEVNRRIEPKDIAITLAKLLDTKPPSGADVEVLTEIITYK